MSMMSAKPMAPPASASIQPAAAPDTVTDVKPTPVESPKESPLISKCVAEFVGTYLLVLTVGCNVLSGNAVWAGVSIASVLMVAIFAFGAISGANFNPAVSVTLGITKLLGGPGLDLATVGIYVLVQVIAGIAAAFSYFMLFGDSFNLAPAKGFGWWEAGLCELLYTFMLCFVVLNVAAAKKYAKEGNQWYGLSIGFVIVAGAYGAGAISGGCFNPAVAIGIDTSSFTKGFGWCLPYMVFELLGAALAAGLFMVVRPGDFKDDDTPTADPGVPEKLTSEFLGTFMLVLTVGLNVLGKSPAGAFSIAASLMCMIYALGDVSGGHFNPAVTLAIFVKGFDDALDAKMMSLYMAVQTLGGICAAFTYAAIYHGSTFELEPQGIHWWVAAGEAEIIFTAVLCLVVLAVACAPDTKSVTMFGLAIGSCVTVGGFAIGSVSGGSLNPAVSIGISTSHLIEGGKFWHCLLYSAYEFTGALMAAGILHLTHGLSSKEKDDIDKVA
mmetsp:Transcript_126885/g.237176  ORF Transcript_126885/g.237176 Transcript_126885/m.237176 type:complete len:497 (-) Transcript_126885:135-1625(-)